MQYISGDVSSPLSWQNVIAATVKALTDASAELFGDKRSEVAAEQRLATTLVAGFILAKDECVLPVPAGARS
jgi:hypothetical protein